MAKLALRLAMPASPLVLLHPGAAGNALPAAVRTERNIPAASHCPVVIRRGRLHGLLGRRRPLQLPVRQQRHELRFLQRPPKRDVRSLQPSLQLR